MVDHINLSYLPLCPSFFVWDFLGASNLKELLVGLNGCSIEGSKGGYMGCSFTVYAWLGEFWKWQDKKIWWEGGKSRSCSENLNLKNLLSLVFSLIGFWCRFVVWFCWLFWHKLWFAFFSLPLFLACFGLCMHLCPWVVPLFSFKSMDNFQVFSFWSE